MWCWRTLESLMDSKEIKPVNPKGNKPWIFIIRTDVEARILWPPDVKIWLFAAPWTAACQASLSFTISQSLLKLMCTESMILSDHLILCCPLFLLPSIFPSIRVFSWLGCRVLGLNSVSGCVCEGVFLMRLAFESVHSVKQIFSLIQVASSNWGLVAN